MEQKNNEGCITCQRCENLCNLFAIICHEHFGTYAQAIETCFDLKVTSDFKYICKSCIETLENAVTFKNNTKKNLDTCKTTKDVEYLDEAILKEADDGEGWQTLMLEVRKEEDLEDRGSSRTVQKSTDPATGCRLCGAELRDHDNHVHSGCRCPGRSSEAAEGAEFTEGEERQYACHFCENVYASKKACFTHLRMKHGLKLCNDQPPKSLSRDRKECHVCGRDFSQKQILNNHLWKAHGIEVEKRKAFFCPLCPERVSYGSQFSAHLLYTHGVAEQVERLEFATMDDFLLFKSAVQEETKYRFRKTTASKQTIEGVRSHYMCSQSGVYVYQGKGKRPAPERQIYKTGKACPAHMVVTETLDNVLVTFYRTHVGHGTCPYYEPREPKRARAATPDGAEGGAGGGAEGGAVGLEGQEEGGLVCDTCGARLVGAHRLRAHRAAHHLHLYPCDYCGQLYQNVDAWTQHIRAEHSDGGAYTF